MSKFDPETSYYKHKTNTVCGICGKHMSHPAILLPAGPAYVRMHPDNIQSEAPLLEYPTIKVCFDDALKLLAPVTHDPNHPDEGKWWREWLSGNLEPVGLRDEQSNPVEKSEE